MLTSEQLPPDVEEKRPSPDTVDAPEGQSRQPARLIGFVLMIVSAIVTLLLLYGVWRALHAI